MVFTNSLSSYYEKFLATGEVKCIDEEIPFEIPKGWEWERWGNIALSIQYGYNAPALERGDIKMVRISDIHDNVVQWENVPFCNIEAYDIDTYLLKENDILLQELVELWVNHFWFSLFLNQPYMLATS